MIKVCLFRELFHLSKVPFVRQFSNLSKPFSLANLKGFERSDNSMANALYIRGLKIHKTNNCSNSNEVFILKMLPGYKSLTHPDWLWLKSPWLFTNPEGFHSLLLFRTEDG